jgi:hypothetical protein
VRVHLCRALSLAAAITLGTTGLGTVTASGATAAAPCAPLTFVGVRDSGEKAKDHKGFGATVDSVRTAVRALVPGTREIAVDYRAVSVKPKGPLDTAYDASVNDGIHRAHLAISGLLRKCARTWIVLAGAGQGADVLGDLFETYLTATERARVAAVAMLADPRFQGRQGAIDDGSYNPGLDGISTQFRGNLRRANYPDREYSLCVDGDPICNWSTVNADACVPGDCVHDWYPTLLLDGQTYTRRAAGYLALRYRQAAAGPKARVLLYGDDDYGQPDGGGSPSANITTVLTQAGYLVTNQAPSDVLPADLTPYGQIWHVSSYSAIPPSAVARLATYVRAGHGLYLTGERPCCETLNASDALILNAVVYGGGILVGGTGDHDRDVDNPHRYPLPLNPAVTPASVRTTPSALARFAPLLPGGLTGVPARHVLARAEDGTAVAAVWSGTAVRGAGRVAILMDINWAEFMDADGTYLSENLALFLSGLATQPGPPIIAPPAGLG